MSTTRFTHSGHAWTNSKSALVQRRVLCNMNPAGAVTTERFVLAELLFNLVPSTFRTAKRDFKSVKMDTKPSPKLPGYNYQESSAPAEIGYPPAPHSPDYGPKPPTYPTMSGAIPSPGPPPPSEALNAVVGYPEGSFARPMIQTYSTQHIPQDIRSAKADVEVGLGELMKLQLERLENNEAGVAERLRGETANVLGDLKALRDEVSDIVRATESHRWRKWLVGGAV